MFAATYEGLTTQKANALIKKYGSNALPAKESLSVFSIFMRQFLNPLIYILLATCLVSIFLREIAGAVFIFIVLLINAIIGTAQEYSAQKAATSLQDLVPTFSTVIRNGSKMRLNANSIVPGDIVILESGNKVPADIELLEAHNFSIDESLLTGESIPVPKDVPKSQKLNEPQMAYSGTMVVRGRAIGKVIGTGINTKIGLVAKSVTKTQLAKPPLLLRMEKFAMCVSIVTLIFIVFIAIILWIKGDNITDIFFFSIALSVSAIPEGLPAAITIILAIGMRRMAEKNVIIRNLLAVESLGSCTFIVSDKTGTLTVNNLTIDSIILPDNITLKVADSLDINQQKHRKQIHDICKIGILANEGYKHNKTFLGDTVDIAFMVLAERFGLVKDTIIKKHQLVHFFPYESENACSASINDHKGKHLISLKGEAEKVVHMCSKMQLKDKIVKLDKNLIDKQIKYLATQGFKVMALASGRSNSTTKSKNFSNLVLLGVVGMIDPLRPEAKETMDRVSAAGIGVSIVTGDNPNTALTIANKLGMNITKDSIITGSIIEKLVKKGRQYFDKAIKKTKLFARIEPTQKQHIVESLSRSGHFVAVTGDGVNDAPALKHAHVGVAMGQHGTDIARENADIVITDNNFRSILSGIIEGRIVYSNIRKVVFLLTSTGAAEVIVCLLSVVFNLPLPLLAIQLLWLNFVIHSIPDVALAFEPGEGNELHKLPRNPEEAIFDKLMIGRLLFTGAYMGITSFIIFYVLLKMNYTIEEARNATLLLMVLFENVQALNSKSETKSIFATNFLNNPLLLYGVLATQLLHIMAMHTSIIQSILHISPIGLKEWVMLFITAVSLLLVEKIFRLIYHVRHRKYD